MEAGRELDALIAENVFVEEHNECRCGYSEDIAMAWEVLEALEKQGFGWNISSPSGKIVAIPEHFLDVYCCRIKRRPYNPWIKPAYGYASTVPHAICLAALKAFEEDNHE